MDLPISRDYYSLVEQAGGEVVAYSKWFSTFVVQMNDSLGISRIETLPFVDSVKYVWRGVDRFHREEHRPRLEEENNSFSVVDTRYGITDAQFQLHNAHVLADAGFRGKGIGVGVIDAGFTNFDVIPWFDTVELRGYKDFVPGGSLFYSSDHGTKVVSTMAVNRPGRMMGSAPDASYWLLRSEDVTSEFPVEEDYWVQAIEYADSVGVDIVNTSLGIITLMTLRSIIHTMTSTGKHLYVTCGRYGIQEGNDCGGECGQQGNKEWQKSTPRAMRRMCWPWVL